jgi:hypothetical protein
MTSDAKDMTSTRTSIPNSMIPELLGAKNLANPMLSSLNSRPPIRDHGSIYKSSPRRLSPNDNLPQRKPTDAPTSFHYFPHLCSELRLQIWELSLPPPRLVPPTHSRIPPSSPNNNDWSGCTSTAAIPTILHVNRDSRAFAMIDKGYSLSLNLIHRQPKIWFKFSIDVLYFSNPSRRRRSTGGDILEAFQNFHDASLLVDPRELNQVRRLAANVGLFKTRWVGNRRCSEEDTLLLQFWQNVKNKLPQVHDVTFYFPQEFLG